MSHGRHGAAQVMSPRSFDILRTKMPSSISRLRTSQRETVRDESSWDRVQWFLAGWVLIGSALLAAVVIGGQ